MIYILFETFTGKICIGKADVEDEKKIESGTIISDSLVIQVVPTKEGSIELKFFPYFFPFSNEMEVFSFDAIYKWKIAPMKLANQYIHVTTGIITDII